MTISPTPGGDAEAPSARLRDFRPRSRRRILCESPRYENSFATFNHAFPLMGDVEAFMPPQGILLAAAMVPPQWEAKFVDENNRPAAAEELAWADAVFVSGMHLQREHINSVNVRAHEFDKLTVRGGPSVSAAPEFYPELDMLHCGEAGDATRRLIEMLDDSCERQPRQRVLRTLERFPMTEFPTPAYHMIDMRQYLLGNIQFSSGFPFTCEFCDIPGLYGRNPRLKSPEQIVAELDLLADGGAATVYFVYDNFIGNPKATGELLPHLIAWQKRRGYNVRLACEGTPNICSYPEILEMMREANFITMFCGFEALDPGVLRAMDKTQNLRFPILDVVEMLNRHDREVAVGIILGLDTDTDETAGAVIKFARISNIPILTVNLLYALPGTPLRDPSVEPSYEEALEKLAGDDPDAARQGGKYLLALFRKSLADAVNGGS